MGVTKSVFPSTFSTRTSLAFLGGCGKMRAPVVPVGQHAADMVFRVRRFQHGDDAPDERLYIGFDVFAFMVQML